MALAAGSYVLEISGSASGPSGGSYTGTLNLPPVPLPPSFLLLLNGWRIRSRRAPCLVKAALLPAPRVRPAWN